MCDYCDHADYLEEIEQAILSGLDSDFIDSVKLFIEDNQHITEKQAAAVDRWLENFYAQEDRYERTL